MDKKRSQEQQECPGSKVQKLEEGVRNKEEERESLSTLDMDKVDAMPDPPSWEQIRERYNKLIQASIFRREEE